MFTIGTFSRFAQVTPDLLRYYDQIDLFKPHHIDDNTGYRYYDIGQVVTLNRIMALKHLGLSLEHVQQLMHDTIEVADIRALLEAQQQKAQETIDREQQKLKELEAHLHYLDSFDSMPHYETIVKSTQDQPWCFVDKQMFPHIDSDTFFSTIYDAGNALGHKGDKHCVCALYGQALNPENWGMGFTFATTKQSPIPPIAPIAGVPFQQSTLTGHDYVASITFQGSMHEFIYAYNQAGFWIQHSDFDTMDAHKATSYEIIHQLDTEPQGTKNIIEIQIPLKLKR